MTQKILCIDDEPNILSAYQRSLRKQFQIETALGGAEALKKIADNEPYAVLVTDMRMPGMDGIQFLKEAQKKTPDSVRIMLTGNADQQTAAQAVNEGHIFRFLNKPCPPEDLARTLTAALEQHRLIIAEKELLEKTLSGTIRMLMEILAAVDPEMFGRAQALRQNMRALTAALQACGILTDAQEIWPLDLAALLSQVGIVTIPPSVTRKVRQRSPLTEMEQQVWQRVPEVGYNFLRNIPRLEPVAQSVRCQHQHFGDLGKLIPVGARMLKVLLDLAEIEAGKVSRPCAFATMQRQACRYDPDILAAASRCLSSAPLAESKSPSVAISLKDLCCGHVLAEDVVTSDGKALLTAGRKLTDILLERLHNYAALAGVKEPIFVETAQA